MTATAVAGAASEVSPAAPVVGGQLQRPSLGHVFLAAAGVFGLLSALRPLHDNSFFVHLATGRWILNHGIPHGDIYSFTASGHSWIAQSWLAEAAYGVADRAFGGDGIRLLVGVAAAFLFALEYFVAWRVTRDRIRAAGVFLVAALAMNTIINERPYLFGLVAFAALVALVEIPTSSGGRRVAWILPPLLWLWTNVHGSVALGFVYIGAHLVGRAVEHRRMPWRVSPHDRAIVVGTGIGLAAMFANPYGLDLVTFPLALMGKSEALRDVVEWRPPDFQSRPGMLFALWLACTFVVLARGQRPRVRDLFVVLPFLGLGVWALRNIAITVIATLPIVARTLRSDRERADAPPRLAMTMLTAVVAVCLFLGAQSLSTPAFDLHTYSVSAMQALEHDGLLGRRLLTTDANAGWVEMHYGARQPTYMDDRYDMFPQRIIDDYLLVLKLKPGWRSVLDRYDIEVVVWPAGQPLAQALPLDPNWRRVRADHDWVTFVRRSV